jgi:hypothetical protein
MLEGRRMASLRNYDHTAPLRGGALLRWRPVKEQRMPQQFGGHDIRAKQLGPSVAGCLVSP